MRRGLALLAMLAGVVFAPAATAAATTCDDDASWTGRGPGVGGATAYDHGELIAQDYIYDDYGAGMRVPRAPVGDTDAVPAGSAAYPGADDPRYLNNGADLRELRLRLEGDTLAIRVELNTMTAPDAAVVGIGLDLDDDPTGVPLTWPHEAQLTTGGTDAVVTLWGTGADVTRRGAAPVALSTACANTDDNTLEVRVP